MAKPIQYCKVINLQLKYLFKIKKSNSLNSQVVVYLYYQSQWLVFCPFSFVIISIKESLHKCHSFIWNIFWAPLSLKLCDKHWKVIKYIVTLKKCLRDMIQYYLSRKKFHSRVNGLQAPLSQAKNFTIQRTERKSHDMSHDKS